MKIKCDNCKRNIEMKNNIVMTLCRCGKMIENSKYKQLKGGDENVI